MMSPRMLSVNNHSAGPNEHDKLCNGGGGKGSQINNNDATDKQTFRQKLKVIPSM